LLVAETGEEGEARVSWLRYVGEEVRAARRAGVPVHGTCLYPILDYPGWDDDRHCHAGLWGVADARGEREVCQPFARELKAQGELFRREGALHELHELNDESADGRAVREREIEHAAF
jgi:hypothetical protein